MLGVEEKIEGISGPNKICTLQPFEVIQIIDEPTPEDPPEQPVDDNPVPALPENKTLINVINWLISVLEWLKIKL